MENLFFHFPFALPLITIYFYHHTLNRAIFPVLFIPAKPLHPPRLMAARINAASTGLFAQKTRDRFLHHASFPNTVLPISISSYADHFCMNVISPANGSVTVSSEGFFLVFRLVASNWISAISPLAGSYTIIIVFAISSSFRSAIP